MRLLHLEQDRDVGRLENAERDGGHDPDDDERCHQPSVVRVERFEITEAQRELESRRQGHEHDGGHDHDHHRHESRGELRAARNRKPPEDGADDEPDEQVDARPQAATNNVVEDQRPQPVAGDRCDQAGDDHRDDRKRRTRHDLNRRPWSRVGWADRCRRRGSHANLPWCCKVLRIVSRRQVQGPHR